MSHGSLSKSLPRVHYAKTSSLRDCPTVGESPRSIRKLQFVRCSVLSVAQFCESIDCSVGSFYLWKRKLAKTTPTPSAFLRVQTLIPAPIGGEIKLP